MRNEEHYIGRCLQSIAQQDYPPDLLEVLVMDGESTDNSRAIVADLARRVPYSLRLMDNPGRITSRGLNEGVKVARGEIIGITSAHSRLSPDFISQGVRLLKEGDIDCVASPITSIGESTESQAIAIAMSSPFGVGNALFRYSHKEQLVDAAAFALYRKEVFDRIGEFDEQMNGDADTDFHYRLTEVGGKILQTPKLESYYYVRSNLRSLFRQYFNYGFSKLVVMRRYPHRVKARQVVPSLFVASLILSAGVGTINRDARTIFGLIVGNYAMVSLATSASLASKVGWQYMPYLPAAFACLHLGYGLGLLRALFRWLVLGESHLPAKVD
jgi:glycosyltransferase involved in cell wall biosynthesis